MGGGGQRLCEANWVGATREGPGDTTNRACRMKVLVVGGAGYIGAHVVRALAVHGQTLIILDDLRASSK